MDQEMSGALQGAQQHPKHRGSVNAALHDEVNMWQRRIRKCPDQARHLPRGLTLAIAILLGDESSQRHPTRNEAIVRAEEWAENQPSSLHR